MDLKGKIKELKNKGFSNAQAFQIAKSMQGRQQYAQVGMNPWELEYLKQPQQFPNQFPEQREQVMGTSPMKPIGTTYEQADTRGMQRQLQVAQGEANKDFEYMQGDANLSGNVDAMDKVDKFGKPLQSNTQYNDINRTNIYNPYGGYDPQQMAWMSGQYFEEGETGMGVAAGAGSVLGFARNFLSGMAGGKEMRRSQKEANDRLYNPDPTYSYGQQGMAMPLNESQINSLTNEGLFGGTNVSEDFAKSDYFTTEADFDMRANLARQKAQPKRYDPYTQNITDITSGTNRYTDDGGMIVGDYKKVWNTSPESFIGKGTPREGKDFTYVNQKQYKDLQNTASYRDYKGTGSTASLQQGGKIKNSEYLTGEFAVEEGQGNINAEGGEYIKRVGGNVQEIVGKPHLEKGKIAEGVNVNLQEGESVLSDYTKYTPENIKLINENYDLKLKKGTTPADAQKTFDKKLGIKKATSELTQYIEESGKNALVKDEVTRKLNQTKIDAKTAEYKNKLDTLKMPQSQFYDYAFALQESQPKIGDGTQLLDKKGKPVTEYADTEVAQQGRMQGGDKVTELANKYGISPQRAQELLMQQGGMQEQPQEEQGGQEEQIMQMVAQALQQGTDPQEIMQQLLQMGVPQEVAQQMVQGVMQQMQGGEQGMAQQGIRYAQEAFLDFSTSLNPKSEGFDITSNSIYSKDRMTGVELTQSMGENGYGKQVQDVNKTIELNPWYFDTDAKKEEFKKASKIEGKQDAIVKFQESYNTEIRKRGKEAGLGDTETDRIVGEVGFGTSGVKAVDGLFGAFTSSRPMFDFKKKTAEEVKTIEGINRADTIENKETTSNVMPWLPQKQFLPPSPGLSPFMGQVSLERMTPIKGSVEPYLANTERNRQTSAEMIRQSGLSPQQAQALIASGLSDSQMADNDAISRVENFNMQSQAQADNFNIGQRSKENLTNEQYKNLFSDKVTAMRDNYDRDLRSFYNDVYMDNANKFQYIDDVNTLNAKNSNFQFIPGQGVRFLNNRPVRQDNTALNSAIEKLTPAQRSAYIKRLAKGEDSFDALNKVRNSLA
jgi:hypothetical protein